MARFNFIHYLFAVFVVLAMAAHARPASSDADMDTVTGMSGMSTKADSSMGGVDKRSGNTPMADTEAEYMEDMKEAIQAAAEAASKATATTAGPRPTTAGPRPTPGVATTVPTTTTTAATTVATTAASAPSKPSGSSKPSPSAAPTASSPAEKSSLLAGVPLIGPMLAGLA